MKKITFVFLLSFATSIIFGQTFVVKVLDDETKLPVAEVHLKFGKEVFLTNVDGFAIISKITSINLEASHVKYHSKLIQLKNRKDLTIYLTEKTQKLDEVIITSKRDLKKYIQYTKLPEIPKSIHSFGSVLLENKLYTFGGDGSEIIYSNRKGLNELTQSDETQIIKFLTQNKPSNFYKYRKKGFCL